MDEKLKIFFCEDDENLGMLLKEFLDTKGFDTDLFRDGEEGIRNFEKTQYDLCILDVMMPLKDGFSVAQEIRSVNSTVPIIFLTAKTMKEDVLHGFTVGGDDYVTKPFSLDELLARIEAIMRRVRGVDSRIRPYYQLGKFVFDTQKQTLTLGTQVTKLTTKESQLWPCYAALLMKLWSVIMPSKLFGKMITTSTPAVWMFTSQSCVRY